MSRRLPALAMLAVLLPPPPAAARNDAHRHQGFVFRIRYQAEPNTDLVYSVYQGDPASPAGMLVERGGGYTGEARTVDLTAARCPALGRAVAALGALPLPAVSFERERHDVRAPRGAQYTFQGFVRFPNGGEGQVSFMAFDVPGREPDAHLAWMRGLVQAFEDCAGRGG